MNDTSDATQERRVGDAERPDFELVLVRACVVAVWADGSMATAERDALDHVIASVVGTQRERDRLRQIVLRDLNRHEVLGEVERLEPEQRLHLFDRCVAILTSDRGLGRRELGFLADLRARCGVGYWAYQRLLLRFTPVWRKVAMVVAVIGIVAAGLALMQPQAVLPDSEQSVAGGDQPPVRALPQEATEHPELVLPVVTGEQRRLDPEQLYQEVRRSVVTVQVRLNDRPVRLGSGAVIGLDSGLLQYFVVTNRHVVAQEVANGDHLSFEVEFENRARFDAVLDFYSRRHDLALLAVQGRPMWVQAVAMRLRQTLTVGEPVFALGSPMGLRHTFTSGVISALRADVIQTDATVHSGSSGGPLFDAHGLLCGVVTATHESKDISFALCADQVIDMLAERRGNRAAP